MRDGSTRLRRGLLFGAAMPALAIGLFGGLAAAPGAAQAQPVQANRDSPRTLNIAPGPLADDLRQFGQAFGIQFVYGSELVQSVTSPGATGSQTARSALDRLLSGTHLTYRFVNARTVSIEAAPAMGDARVLGAVQVEGVQNEGFVPLNGFGAGAGANGSSDPTATEGTGSLTTNGASVASKAAQSLKDTPQSVTVITQERIQQQNLTDLNSALNYTPGITLQQTDAENVLILSRGFQITSFQIDGGAPISLVDADGSASAPNLAEFDSVQVVRGSDALFGGAGDPSGVVNLQRKRPLDHDQLTGEVDIGSWNNYRVEVDATGPIAFDGHLRARLVVSDQDRDFFYNVAHQNRAFVYGTLEGDLGPNTILRVGASFEQQRNPGFNADGLPRFEDGGDLGLSRSTCLCANWARYDPSKTELFATVEHRFNSDWVLTADLTRINENIPSLLPLLSGTIGRDDETTSYAESDIISSDVTRVHYAADIHLSGAFQLFGLKQTILIGEYYSRDLSNFAGWYSFPNTPFDVFDFTPSLLNPPPPSMSNSEFSSIFQEQSGTYLKIDLHLLDPLHVTAGVRVSDYRFFNYSGYLDTESGKDIYSFVQNYKEKNIATPYASITYDITRAISIYASYADIYQSQAGLILASGGSAPPETGVTYEGGVKGSFKDGKLNASLSIYYTDEGNYTVLDPSEPFNGSCCFLLAGNLIADGVDFEFAGEVRPGWQIQFGYNFNENRYSGLSNYGEAGVIESQQPKHQIKMWTSYIIPGRFSRWTVGGGLRLESKRSEQGVVCAVAEVFSQEYGGLYCPGAFNNYNFTQSLYAVADLTIAYRISSHWQAALNVTNIGDTRYYATAGSTDEGNFYGEPRAFMFSLRGTF